MPAEKTPEEIFAETFASEAAPDSGADNAAAEAQVAEDEAAAAAKEADDAEIAAADAAKEADDKPDEEGEPAATEEEKTEPAATDEVKTEPAAEVDLKAENDRLAAELAALKAKPADVKKDEPEPSTEQEVAMPKEPTAATVLNEEELGIVATYEEEWADVSKAESLKRKVDMAIMEDRIYREVAVALKSILGTVNPIVEDAQAAADARHYAAIEAAHPDYLEVSKTIDGWIEKQPKYLQTAMNTVLDHGSAVEVNDLFTRFKQETGRVTPQVIDDKTLLQNKPAVDEAVVQALTPVKGGRKTAVTATVDPNDFAGAWAVASKQ